MINSAKTGEGSVSAETTPLPNPPPQGGREQKISATLRFNFQTAASASRSRRAIRASFARNFRSLKQRAQGMPGARCARSLVCKNKKAHKHSHHGHTGNTRHSPRNGFNGFLRALPGDRALLSPSPVDCSTDLTPASGRQDHTTSPSALAPFVKGAITSIASRTQRP